MTCFLILCSFQLKPDPPSLLAAIPSIEIAPVHIKASPVPAVPVVPLQPVQLPGCVASHPDAALNPSLLRDDPGRVGYACGGAGLPSFKPLDFRGAGITILQPEPVREPAKGDEGPPPPAPIPTIQLPTTKAHPDPAEPAAKPSIVRQVLDELPTAGEVAKTATIAVVATSAALLAKPLADLLLKLIKPAVKQVMAKLKALQGQTPRPLSVSERRLAQRDRNRALMALRRALGR